MTVLPILRRGLKPQQRADAAFLILGLSGIYWLFVDFIFVPLPIAPFPSMSPWDVILSNEFWAVLPLFLSIPITVGFLLLLMKRRVPPIAWVVGYSLALAAVGVGVIPFYLLLLALNDLPTNLGDWLYVAVSVTALSVGSAVVIRNFRLGLSHDRNAIVAMQVAYLVSPLYLVGPLPWVIFVSWAASDFFFADSRYDLGAWVYAIFFVLTPLIYIAHIGYASLVVPKPSPAMES